jgi:hypothetical protein
MPPDQESTGAAGSTPSSAADSELKAMASIVEALKPLTERECQRVLEYVLGRFNVRVNQAQSTFQSAISNSPLQSILPTSSHISDIRSLKEAKNPKSANEMAALVAYYVSELAPAEQRSKQINKADVERYFKMAGFKLPADAAFTLVNAKNAGYLDTAGSGQYTLNPVGYNLVVHRMGAEKDEEKRPTKRSKKSTSRRKK